MSANLRFSSNSVNGKNSLGGAIMTSSNGIYTPNTTAANVVFDEVLKSENINGTPDYRCLYIKNDFASQTVYSPQFEFKTATQTAKFQIGFLSDKNVTAEAISNENTAPAGISFIDLPDNATLAFIKGASDMLLTGEFVGFWLKRIPTNLGSTGTVTGEFVFQTRYKN